MPHGGFRTYGGLEWLGSWDPETNRYVLMYGGRTYRVARLVCEAFHGPPPDDKPLCLHGDEDSRNNRADNLRWGTPSENMNEPLYLSSLRQRTASLWYPPGHTERGGLVARPARCVGCGWNSRRIYAAARGCHHCNSPMEFTR